MPPAERSTGACARAARFGHHPIQVVTRLPGRPGSSTHRQSVEPTAVTEGQTVTSAVPPPGAAATSRAACWGRAYQAFCTLAKGMPSYSVDASDSGRADAGRR
jgi:hypothetical protein